MTPGLAFALRAGAHPRAALGWAIALVLLAGFAATMALAVIVERRRCHAASLARVRRGLERVLPADPKEDQNDGDPIRAAHEVWLACPRCGCRHPASEHCPSLKEAALRRAEDMRAAAKARAACEKNGSKASAERPEVALANEPLSAPEADRRSDPEDGRANARGRPACEPSRSDAEGNAAAQAIPSGATALGVPAQRRVRS